MENLVRVLIVDDDCTNRYIITENLKKIIKEASDKMLNIIFEEASDGLEAIEKHKENYFDLVLMDINMPRMSGYEATPIIKKISQENGKNIKVVAVTCLAYSEKIQECGFDEFILKPLGAARIKSLLKSL